MKIILTPLLLSTFLLISACGDTELNSSDKQKFEAYLKSKRIPMNDEERYDRMLVEFERRGALANEIGKTDVLDNAIIDAEIEEFRKELLISRYFEAYLDGAVTEQGIQNFYSNNIDKYRSRKIKVSHILFRVTPQMAEVERQVLLTKAMDARSRMVAGASFEEVAKEVSEDVISGQKGGDLGWINEGAISQEFSDKVFAMTLDELSDPFLTDYGFHIIKVTQAPQEVTKSLDSVKGDIRYQLRNQSKKAETERLLENGGYKTGE